MSSDSQPEWNTLFEVISLLETYGINYMLTGSLAKTFYATPRMTRDIDIVVELDSINPDLVVQAFKNTFYIERVAVDEAISNSSMFNILHNRFHVKVDLIVRKRDSFRMAEFKRRRSFTIQGRTVWVTSPEDLILSKLYWAKDSHSEMQISDIRDLFRSVKNLDHVYIKKWVEHLSLQTIFLEVQDA